MRLQKRFPQTLSIAVTFRQPQALLQGEHGSLSYVDQDGMVFGQVNLLHQPDLPVLQGLDSAPAGGPRTLRVVRVQEALRLIAGWDASPVAGIAQISTLTWDAERGFRAWVTYSMGKEEVHGRVLVDLGQEVYADMATQFSRLSRVFNYLSVNRVAARQIWADSGKKIVVRTAHGS